MPEHPVILIAEETMAVGGTGLELAPTLSGEGAFLRVWLPDLDSARTVAALSKRSGLDTRAPVQHLDAVGDTRYRGYQLVAYIPNALLESARAAMESPIALAAGGAELTAATRELTAGD